MICNLWPFLVGIVCFLAVTASSHRDCSKDCKAIQLAEPPDTTEWEVEMEARCFTGCVDLLSSVCNCTINMFPSLEELQHWNTFKFMDEEIDCTAYQKVSDCQRGCIIKAKNSEKTKNQCRDDCYTSCPTEYDGTICSTKCRAPQCAYGCQVYDSFIGNNEKKGTPSPPTPPYEPILLAREDLLGGQFVYSTSHHSERTPDDHDQDSSGNETLTDSVAFVLRIVTQNETVFLWKWTYYGHLDLGFAKCQEVNISIKAVSKYSSSEYSPVLNTCIYGEKQYPGQINPVTDLKFYFSEDFRPGFERHAIANISWTKPQGSQFLSNYRLTIFSQTNGCGGVAKTYEHNIDKDATSFIISAEEPGHPIFFQCQYLIRLISEPTLLMTTQVPHTAVNAESVSAPNAEIIMKCHSEIKSNGNYDIYAFWRVTEYPGLTEATEKYAVLPQEIHYRNQISPTVVDWKETIDIIPNVNNTINIAVIKNAKPLEGDKRYRLRVDAVSNGQFPWRQMPKYSNCIVDAYPEPSSSINSSSIKVLHLEFNQKFLFLNISWHQPEIPHGIATSYEVRIAREYLEPTEMDDPTDYSLRTLSEGNSTSLDINATQIYQLERLPCLFLQIRCQNNYNLWSNWSSPIVLRKYPESDPKCLGILPDVTSMSTTSQPKPTLMQSLESKKVSIPFHIIGGVIGSVMGLILLILVIVILTVLIRRYRRRNRYLEAFKDIGFDPMYVGGSHNIPDNLATTLTRSPKLDEWEIPAAQVIIENRLGEGCFGEVYQGMVKGPINNPKIQASLKNTICPVVAIKLLKSTATGRERVDFLQEIDTMKSVAKGNNPHVVNMVGCVTIQEPLCLITEFVKYGDLSTYLKSIRKIIMEKRQSFKEKSNGGAEPYLVPHQVGSSEIPSEEMPYKELGDIENVNLLSFAYQIASGMEYLASLGIVHRDLACRNILVGEGKSLKISDFGMSRTLGADDVYIKNTKGRLPWKWMAIESILNREFTSASDVWSYGVTIWEIATLGGFPYPAILNADLLEHIQRGLRLEKPDNCSPEVYEIMLECWQTNPNERPTFTSLRAKFDALITAQKDHNPYIDLDIDCCKPYYNPLLNTDDDSDEKDSSSGISTNSSSPPHESCSLVGPRFGNISSENLPRPVSNPYVDSPTNYVRSFSMGFTDMAENRFGNGNLDLSQSHELKGSLQLTEII